LIIDEIQTGLGRTGEWFAYTRSGVQPDVLILGKPLGGGIPLSAILVNEQLFHDFGVAKHGSTLGGSPMACRLGLEFLNIVAKENLLARVGDTGEYFLQKLGELASASPVGVEARGRGLLLGMQLSVPARPVCEAALERGFMLNMVHGNVLRFLPSFLLERHHVDVAIEEISRILNAGDVSGKPGTPEKEAVPLRADAFEPATV
jgi:acetylornithine/succinyldiaminopimelate/putrescine aminotransferase